MQSPVSSVIKAAPLQIAFSTLRNILPCNRKEIKAQFVSVKNIATSAHLVLAAATKIVQSDHILDNQTYKCSNINLLRLLDQEGFKISNKTQYITRVGILCFKAVLVKVTHLRCFLTSLSNGDELVQFGLSLSIRLMMQFRSDLTKNKLSCNNFLSYQNCAVLVEKRSRKFQYL